MLVSQEEAGTKQDSQVTPSQRSTSSSAIDSDAEFSRPEALEPVRKEPAARRVAAADKTTSGEKSTEISAAAVQGEVVWLISQSRALKHLFMLKINWLLLPSVQFHEFRIWWRDNQSIGYAGWLYLSDVAFARFESGISGTKLHFSISPATGEAAIGRGWSLP